MGARIPTKTRLESSILFTKPTLLFVFFLCVFTLQVSINSANFNVVNRKKVRVNSEHKKGNVIDFEEGYIDTRPKMVEWWEHGLTCLECGKTQVWYSFVTIPQPPCPLVTTPLGYCTP